VIRRLDLDGLIPGVLALLRLRVRVSCLLSVKDPASAPALRGEAGVLCTPASFFIRYNKPMKAFFLSLLIVAALAGGAVYLFTTPSTVGQKLGIEIEGADEVTPLLNVVNKVRDFTDEEELREAELKRTLDCAQGGQGCE